MFNPFNPFGSQMMPGGMQNPLQQPMRAPFGAQSTNPMSNIATIVNRFNDFKKNFEGDPQEKVQAEIKARGLNDEQVGQLEQAVQMLRGVMGGNR